MLTFLLVSAALAASPDRTGYVTDVPDLIPDTVQAELESQLAASHDRSGFEVVVLVVPTIGHEEPLAYATAARRDWKLGGEDKNGVLLLVVPPPEKQLAITTGPGARPYLTDGDCFGIREDVMRPLNQGERRVDAILVGVDAILAELGSEPVAERTPPASELQTSDVPSPPPEHWYAAAMFALIILFFVGIFTFLMATTSDDRRPRGRSASGGGGYYDSSSTHIYIDNNSSGGGYSDGGGCGGDGGGGDGGGSD